MSTWTILLGLFVLILIPRLIAGRTPVEPEPAENPRERHADRCGFRDAARLAPPPPSRWAMRGYLPSHRAIR